MSDKLLDERPLIVLPSLAKRLNSVDKAIILQQIHWLAQMPRYGVMRDGHKWVYATYKSWVDEHFPFWTPDALRKHVTQLERSGWLFSAQPDMAGGDATKYYRVNYQMVNDPSGQSSQMGGEKSQMGGEKSQMGGEKSQMGGEKSHTPRKFFTGGVDKSHASIYRTETTTETTTESMTTTETTTESIEKEEENTRAGEADFSSSLFQPLTIVEEVQPMPEPESAPAIETHTVQAAVPTPPVAAPLPAQPPVTTQRPTTGDPLMDIAAAKFAGRQRGREFANAWQAEMNLEVSAAERTPIAQKLAEIWGMTASIDAGNDSANRTCHEVAARLYKAKLVKGPGDLDVHYKAYLADDWRRQNAPQPKPESFEKFISQSVAAIAGGLNQLKGQANANTTNHRNPDGWGRVQQPGGPAGGATPDFSRYNRNKANRQPATGA